MLNAPTAPTYSSGHPSIAPTGTASLDEARCAGVQFLGRLAAEVSVGRVNLPCFPDIVIRVRRALVDPKNTPERTVTIIGTEPLLAARLLQTANSVVFNPTGRPLTDLRTAVTRLGHQLVQSAAMAYAVQHMRNQESLRTIAKPLAELWADSVSVAALCQVVARRTRVMPDEAFLTGLLHGVGRLYILVRSLGDTGVLHDSADFLEMVSGWHAAIGKAVLENWGFAKEMCQAVGDQGEHQPRRRHEADLTDILLIATVLGETLRSPHPHSIDLQGSAAFTALGLSAEDCPAILLQAEQQLVSLNEALGG